jgi:hypothetical protein
METEQLPHELPLPNAPPPDAPPINAPLVNAPPAAEPRRSERVPTAPERFAETSFSQWSVAEMARRDERHGRVWEEAVAQEPALAAELEKLFSRAREQPLPSATVAGGGASDEVEGEMARAAATTLHAALLELISLSQTDDEMSHIWTDEAPPPALRVRAYIYTGGCVDEQRWGELAIAPPMLTWTPSAAEMMANSRSSSSPPLTASAARTRRTCLLEHARTLAARRRTARSRCGVCRVRARRARSCASRSARCLRCITAR